MSAGFLCPRCKKQVQSIVVDSRPVNLGVRRRRACGTCGKRFTTYEISEKTSRILTHFEETTVNWMTRLARTHKEIEALHDAVMLITTAQPIETENTDVSKDDIHQRP